jgi:ferredoxin/flavodoxin
MNTAIYYFTGTGNSLAIARDMARELGDATVIPIPRALREGVDQSFDRIGIVFPVYIWGLPLIVSRFINKLSDPGAYYFVVADFAGMACSTLAQAQRLFRGKGLKLSAGFGIRMPGNYTPMYGAVPDRKQKKMFDAGRMKIRKIAEAVREKKDGILEDDFLLLRWLFSGIFYRFSVPHIPEMDKTFWVDERCNGCGICQQVCPVENVQVSEGKPRWRHACEQCLACLQWCPPGGPAERETDAGQKTVSSSGSDACRHPRRPLAGNGGTGGPGSPAANCFSDRHLSSFSSLPAFLK